MYRTSIEYMDYWFGLRKVDAAVLDSATFWLDGNPSAFRNWAYDPNDYSICVRYQPGGYFNDHNCYSTFLYTCKMPACEYSGLQAPSLSRCDIDELNELVVTMTLKCVQYIVMQRYTTLLL